MTEKETQQQIDEQLKALRKATNEAIKSKEAANRYLIEAGIITDTKESRFIQQNQSKR
ncbi:MAG: hypothetical protein LH478_07810 [Chitinophagaceae bacterium]|nr:hypothetical protein [Chitinophagaceae bacterium]